MDKLKAIADGLYLDYSELERLLSDDSSEEDIQSFCAAHDKARMKYFESKYAKEIGDRSSDEAIKKYQIKVKKKFNSLAGLGLTNKEMDQIDDIDEIYKLADKKIAEKLTKSQAALSDETIQELNKWKTLATQREQALEKLEDEKHEFENSVRSKYESEFIKKSAGIEYRKKINEWREKGKIVNAPGVDLALKQIQNEIFSEYSVDENLNVFDKDTNSIATHPEKNINVNNVMDIVKFKLEKANLIKKNNSGEKPSTFLNMQKTQVVNGEPKELSAEAQADIERLNALVGG